MFSCLNILLFQGGKRTLIFRLCNSLVFRCLEGVF